MHSPAMLLSPHSRLHLPGLRDSASSNSLLSRLAKPRVVYASVVPCSILDCQSPTFPSPIEDPRLPSLQKGRKLVKLPNSQYSITHIEFALELGAENSSEESELKTDYNKVHGFDYGSSWGSESMTNGAMPDSFRKRFDKLDFAREYDILALRVPAAECRKLEYRLGGHLLHWPRINNMARVEGDDVDSNIKDLVGSNKEDGTVTDSLRTAVYGVEKPSGRLSERIKLVQTFGRRTCRHFRILDKMSRTKSASLMTRRKDGSSAKNRIQGKAYTVEIVEERKISNSDKDEEAIYRKMGLGIRKWAGPTRLLLLDSIHAGKSASELPMAVQVLLNERMVHTRGKAKREIVACKITLLYDYWSLDEILEELLPGVPISSLYTTVGQIAHLNTEQKGLPFKYLVAKVIYDKQRPKIQTVVVERDSTRSPFGTAQLEVLAGNHSLVTRVIENGIPFHVNLATVYWSSTLAAERHRLLESFNEKDIVCMGFQEPSV